MDLSLDINTDLISFPLDPYKIYNSGFVWTVACEYLDLSYPIVTMNISLQELEKMSCCFLLTE